MTSHKTLKHQKVSICLLVSLLIVGLFLFLQPAFADQRLQVPDYQEFGAPASKADAIAVNQLLANFKKAWGEQDTAALMTLYADDIEWINAYARMFRGHEHLSLFLENVLFPRFHESVSKKEIANMKPISLRYLGGDVAVFHGYTDGNRGKSTIKGRKYRRTHFHFVMHKREGQWLFVHKTISDARDTK